MSRLHVIEIRQAEDRPSHAMCSCGWLGSALTLPQAVAAEGRAHARDATRADVAHRRSRQREELARYLADRADCDAASA